MAYIQVNVIELFFGIDEIDGEDVIVLQHFLLGDGKNPVIVIYLIFAVVAEAGHGDFVVGVFDCTGRPKKECCCR